MSLSGELSLCLACGLCCDGTLYAHVRIKREHVESVRALGLAVEAQGKQIFFLQPCRLYQAQCCSVYPNHPATCQAYQCDLLKKYLAATVTRAQALCVIQQTRDLLDALTRKLPPGYSITRLRRELGESWDAGDGLVGSPELRKENAELLLAYAALTRYLRKHFEKPKKDRKSDTQNVNPLAR